MSEVIKEVKDRDLAHIVKLGDEFYYVDSADTFDMGFETMVFSVVIDDGEEDINWTDLYCERYSSENAMEIKHKYIIEHLEEFLPKERKEEK